MRNDGRDISLQLTSARTGPRRRRTLDGGGNGTCVWCVWSAHIIAHMIASRSAFANTPFDIITVRASMFHKYEKRVQFRIIINTEARNLYSQSLHGGHIHIISLAICGECTHLYELRHKTNCNS